MANELDIPSLVDALDSLRDGVQILSPEWRYLHVNEAAARQGRKPRSELLGSSMLELYPGIDQTPMFERLQRCMSERVADAMENEFTYDDGERAWFELRIQPCKVGLVLLSLDMTERKSVQLQLEDAYRQALRDLVTPVITVHHRVLLVPLIGALESQRASHMTDHVLSRVTAEHAKVVIFDVAGLPALDTAVANHLIQTTAMIRMLGATTILTGVRAAAAKAMIGLGIDLSAMETTTELASGIELAIAKVR